MAKVILMVALALGMVGTIFGQNRRPATLSQQKMCADRARKQYDDYERGLSPEYRGDADYTSHYDAKLNICYMAIFSIRMDKDKDDRPITWMIGQVSDAFEGRVLGLLTSSHAIGESESVLSCDVHPIGQKKQVCANSREWSALVDKYFHLGTW